MKQRRLRPEPPYRLLAAPRTRQDIVRRSFPVLGIVVALAGILVALAAVLLLSGCAELAPKKSAGWECGYDGVKFGGRCVSYDLVVPQPR